MYGLRKCDVRASRCHGDRHTVFYTTRNPNAYYWKPKWHYSERDTCRYYAFPKDKKEAKKWITAIRRADREPSKHSLVCSCHFKDGIKENGPSLFPRNSKKYMHFPPAESKKRKQKESIRESSTGAENGTAEAIEVSQDEDASNMVFAASASLEAENYFLKQEIEKLKAEVAIMKSKFSFKAIEGSDKLILLYTGLPNSSVFKLLYEFCTKFEISYYSGWNVDCLTKEDQLFMTLIKLRQNLLHEDLGVRFNVSHATVSNIIITWLHVLHELLYEGLMTNVPSLLKNQACLPNCFSNFTSCRIIIDCTEVYTVMPKSMANKQRLYSHYKHRTTLKGLVAVAPNGVVTFASRLYGGSASDKMITKDCSILDILKPGDLVLADKGFLISDIVPEGVCVNVPPFLETPQFTEEQVLRTRSIARARIHVERAICRIKGYSVLEFIPQTLQPYASKVWQVCAALTNFQCPLLKEVEVYFKPNDKESA